MTIKESKLRKLVQYLVNEIIDELDASSVLNNDPMGMSSDIASSDSNASTSNVNDPIQKAKEDRAVRKANRDKLQKLQKVQKIEKDKFTADQKTWKIKKKDFDTSIKNLKQSGV